MGRGKAVGGRVVKIGRGDGPVKGLRVQGEGGPAGGRCSGVLYSPFRLVGKRIDDL